MALYDISRSIGAQTAVWPGDTPFQAEHLVKKGDGAAINLTQITLSPHTATHADAPFHFQEDGIHPHQMPLEPFMGRAQVITIERQNGAITPADIADKVQTPAERILIHTWVSELPDTQFPEDFPYPSVALIDWLADHGAVLLGMDSPSMDDLNSKTLDGHHQLRARGMWHLESLCLRGVPDGIYELIALPLKIEHICGSPVRAVLRDI